MKTIINTDNAPAPLGPYNQAVLTGNTLYISGQISINPETNELVLSDIKSETLQVMKNLGAILEAADLTFNNVVKSSIFISNMDDFAPINEVYGSFFDDANAPARETVQVAKLPKGVNVEISMIASVMGI
ncbi:RidA family protein [Hyunsoonleella sp. SJ7]|uniref:RidA family protein n=1 Tax=Hyunsoonleella aquatilis TaxID=2762758 RepID=A0A923HFV5_9FLAO|nr:RidA family protein [Hyunsoonleella aquatilis]MBC3758625.1 RidA family protein [Hyunsoonleella aquatilis]